MKFVIAFLLLWMCCELVRTQCPPNSLPLEGFEHARISAVTSFFEDTTGRLSLEAILGREFGPMPTKNWMEKTNTNARSRIWMRFSLDNIVGTDTLRLVFFPGVHGLTTLFGQNSSNIIKLAQGGLFAYKPAFTWQANLHCLPLEVPPGRCPTYLVSVHNFFKMYDQVRAELFTPDTYRSYCQAYKERQLPVLLFLGFVIGGLAILTIFGLMQFLLTRGPASLWYALFAFANGLNFVRVLEMFSDARWVSNLIPEFQIYLLVTPSALTFFYLHFIWHFLDFHLQNNARSLWFGRVITLFGVIFFLTVVAGVILFTWPEFGSKIAFWYRIVHFLVFFLTFLVLFLVLKAKGVLPRVIAAGTLLLVTGAVLSTLMDRIFVQLPMHEMSLSKSPSFWLGIFTLLENLCFALGLGYKTKLLEVEKRLAIESTRSQIAQDIHDDLGTNLSKISMGASLAALIPDLDRDALREKLRSIGAEAQEVAQHLRDVVFIINPRFDAFSEVQGYYRGKSRDFLESVGLEPHFDFPKPKHNPIVPPEVKRQLFLLLRECLNNIAKHAHATEVFIVFRLEEEEARAERLAFLEKPLAERQFTLEIRDNGQGFDLEDMHHFSSGLKGMARRAEKIGANLEINSALGHGTTIRLVGRL